MAEVRFRLTSSFDEVPPVGEAIRAFGERAGLTAGDAGFLELAVVEAVNNAIEHAYGEQPGGRIEVRCTIDGDTVTAEVYDEGPPIDEGVIEPRGLEGYTADDRESLPEGGRGLAIMRGIFDEVAVERVGTRNRVHMTKRRAAH